MVGHDEMRQQGLSLRSRTFDAVSRQPGKLPFDPIWSELAEDVELSPPRGFRAPIGQIDDHALFDTVDRSVRLVDEALQTIREPVIAPGLPAIAVHALLDHGPVSVISDDEAVEIEVKPILDRRAIDLGDEPTRFCQRRAVETDPITDRYKLMWRPPRMIAAPAADVDTELSRQGRQAALQRADDARGDAGGMPVHSHHCAERLEPEGMRQPAQKLIAAILEDDRLGDHRAQPSHSIAQPFGHAAAVKRQVGATRTPHHQCSPVAVTLGAASGWGTIASATPNSSSSSAVLAGDWSKFDTVTPSSRMPLAVGSSVRTSSRLA